MTDDRPDFTWEEFSAGKGSGGDPPKDADRFKPCFRHKERTTGITCQRCDRPICGECMRPASVGFQCPVCVAEQQMAEPPVTNRVGKKVSGGGRRPRSFSGPSVAGIRLAGGPTSTTVVLMIVMAIVGVMDLFGRMGMRLLGFSEPLVISGQLWRLVTGIVVAGSPFQLLINLLFLWLVGRSVEADFGRGRMLAVLALSGLGGSAALMLFMPVQFWPMSYGAILGMLAAVAAAKRRFGEDIRGDLLLLGIMVAFSVVIGNVPGWISQIGAILAGGAAGAIIAYAPRENRTRTQVLGLAGLAGVLLVLAFVRVLIGV